MGNIIKGAASSAILLVVYFAILALASGPEHVYDQFMELWYFILPLVAGFGIQIGLFSFIRDGMKSMSAGTVASTGGVTTGSMVACCVHHVTDVVPVLGATALGLFLLQYQAAFMLLGILSNIIGITMMLHIIQKHSLQGNMLRGLFRLDMIKVRNITALASAAVLIAFVAITGLSTPQVVAQQPSGRGDTILTAEYSSENGLSIEAVPVLSPEGISISLSFNTHSGDLGYDFTEVSVLVDSEGNSYSPLRWEGPPPGGHHISGRLIFPPLEGEPGSMKLVMKGVYDVPERIFEWNL